MKVVKTARGARIVEGDVVLSEIRATPGPTHSLFDVLAACVAALAPGPRCAVLGFAGGGMIAPLRAMGFTSPLVAVDLSRDGERVFRRLSRTWAGRVGLAQADAVEWLRRQRSPFDLIVEDLSVPSPAGTVKPYASFDTLPSLVRARLRPRGVAVTNLLPLPGTSWSALLARVALPHRRAVVLTLDEYENRFVLAGRALPTAAEVSLRVRRALRGIGSYQAKLIRLRTLLRD
jgi:spermidine synthase